MLTIHHLNFQFLFKRNVEDGCGDFHKPFLHVGRNARVLQIEEAYIDNGIAEMSQEGGFCGWRCREGVVDDRDRAEGHLCSVLVEVIVEKSKRWR